MAELETSFNKFIIMIESSSSAAAIITNFHHRGSARVWSSRCGC
jgi:hypothetical protein